MVTKAKAAQPKAPPKLFTESDLNQNNQIILEEYRAYKKAQDEALAKCKADNEAAKIENDKPAEGKKKKVKRAIKKCKEAKKACVPSEGKKTIPLNPEIGKAVNDANGTKVDFAQIARWEGGVYLEAYQPWWPDLQKSADGVYVPVVDAKLPGGPMMRGTVVDKAGNRNGSGVTVAKGVDFGPKANKARYFSDLDAMNKRGGFLTDAELKALKEKIDPYIGKRGADACVLLREKPLSITAKEADLLNAQAASEATEQAMTKYKKKGRTKFLDLPVEAQTSTVSSVYQTGRLPKGDYADLISAGQYSSAADLLTRERGYLKPLGDK